MFFGFVLQEEIIPVFSSVCCLYIWWSAPNEQTSKIWTEEATSALVFEPRRLQVGTSSHLLPLTSGPEDVWGSSHTAALLVQQQAHKEMTFLCFCYSGLCPESLLNTEMIPFDLPDHSTFEEGRNQWLSWRTKVKIKEDMRKSAYHCNAFTMQAPNVNKHIKMLVLFSLTTNIMFVKCIYTEYLVRTLISITVR